MNAELFIIYLIYGFIYLLFGFRIITLDKQLIPNQKLVHGVLYIAVFGLIHGLSEWLTVLRLSGLFQDYDSLLVITKNFLKLGSFLALFTAGINMLPISKSLMKQCRRIPILLGLIYIFIFVFATLRHHPLYLYETRTFNVFFIRYLTGFLGALTTSVAFFLASRHTQLDAPNENRYLRGLAWVFLLYAFVDGLIVRNAGFFPSTWLNNENFLMLLGFRIQWVKILIGFSLYVLVSKLIHYQQRLQNHKLKLLSMQTIEMDARCKIGYELHDSVIQNLYGLKLQAAKLKKEHPDIQALTSFHSDINNSLTSARKFLENDTLQRYTIAQFDQKLKDLIQSLSSVGGTHIVMDNRASFHDFFPEAHQKLTQLYFSLQEVLLNAYKHAKATRIDIVFAKTDHGLSVSVTDNGVGFLTSPNERHEGLGIMSLYARMHGILGSVEYVKLSPGTKVILNVPKEGTASNE